jgi:hypothetical protein
MCVCVCFKSHVIRDIQIAAQQYGFRNKKTRVVGIANSIVEQHWGQSSPVPNMHYAKTLHDFIHPVYNQIGAELR